MRPIAAALVVAACAAAPAPAPAQLNTYYKGTVREGGKDVPTTAQFSVEAGRAAVIMKTAPAARQAPEGVRSRRAYSFTTFCAAGPF